MKRLFKIATPIPADARFVEACQEIFAIACRRRAIVEAAGDRIDLYFEQLSDATACVDLVEALTTDLPTVTPSRGKSSEDGARLHR